MTETARVRGILSTVRFEAAQLRGCFYAGVHAAAGRIIASIDNELARPDACSACKRQPNGWRPDMDAGTIPTEVLLGELGRRVREARRMRKLCTRCEEHPARAKGLCMRCYLRDRKGKARVSHSGGRGTVHAGGS